jgi:hypothetical protein
VPFHVSAVDGTKPLPVTVICKSEEPAAALEGLIVVMVGAGLFTVKLTAAEVPPPGDGFSTVSFAAMPFAKSVAGIVACKLEDETKVVARAEPFHSMAEEEMKPEPATVTAVAASPAVAEDGVTEATVGVAFVAPDGGGVVEPPPPPPQPARDSSAHKINAMTADAERGMGVVLCLTLRFQFFWRREVELYQPLFTGQVLDFLRPMVL